MQADAATPLIDALRKADDETLEALSNAANLDAAATTSAVLALLDKLDAFEEGKTYERTDHGLPPLPEPAPGNGFVVLEAPLELVAVFAALHPSEMGTAAAQMAGRMRESLVEMRRMPPRMGASPAAAATAVAVVSPNADAIEANL